MNETDKPIANYERREPLVGLVNASKSLFFLALAIFACVAGYLVWTNPSINSPLNQQRIQQDKAKAEEESAKPREWSYDMLSDVGTTENKYPIVVLRTGFKVIRVGAERSLVGWKYELVNTSPKTKYVPSITFTLQDADGFDIASGNADTILQAETYGVITGTISIENVDIERLSQSIWSIRLSPDWETNERQTPGERYSRLKKLAESGLPFWVRESAKEKVLGIFAEKWKAIQAGLGIEVEEKPADKSSGE